jgi:hypothetical protein
LNILKQYTENCGSISLVVPPEAGKYFSISCTTHIKMAFLEEGMECSAGYWIRKIIVTTAGDENIAP